LLGSGRSSPRAIPRERPPFCRNGTSPPKGCVLPVFWRALRSSALAIYAPSSDSSSPRTSTRIWYPPRSCSRARVALEGDRQRGLDLARAFRTKWPDRPEGAALIALAWARDPRAGAAPRAEQARAARDQLPTALRTVPSAIDALQAIEKRSLAEAKTAVEQGLSAATTPGVATWLGSIALQMGDDVLARRAALQAVSFSAIYPQARVLAARVLRSPEGGSTRRPTPSPSSIRPRRTWSSVRAATAYERMDADGLGLAIDGLARRYASGPSSPRSPAPRTSCAGEGGRAGQAARAGKPEVAWGDIIALDAALDSGNLPLAKEIVDGFRDATDRPPRALRVARYLRYAMRAADATGLQARGRDGDGPRHGRARAGSSRDRQTRRGACARRPQRTLLGPMASWVLARIDADGQRLADARAKAALFDPPGPVAPLTWRVVAALAMADLGDRKRGVPYVRALAKIVPRNPDVVAAAGKTALGFRTAREVGGALDPLCQPPTAGPLDLDACSPSRA